MQGRVRTLQRVPEMLLARYATYTGAFAKAVSIMPVEIVSQEQVQESATIGSTRVASRSLLRQVRGEKAIPFPSYSIRQAPSTYPVTNKFRLFHCLIVK